MTDSNGRDATANSIKNHMSREEKSRYDIKVSVAFTLDEAIQRVDRGAIDVRDSVVVVDNLTNDIRGTRLRPSLNPRDLVRGVDRLRGALKSAGAMAVVVCQVKPMELGDVTPYNDLLSEYLAGERWGFGCRTQIRLGHLKPDGYHIKPQFYSIVDRTYALGRLRKTLNFISISGKKLLFTFAKKMLSLKGKNSGAMSWLSAEQQRK